MWTDRLAVLLVFLAACNANDVVVADLADAAPSSTAPPGGAPCNDNGQCSSDAFCNKDSCDAPMGHCKRWPLMCEPHFEPTCGCDGVTYWSDCLRQQRGVPASTPGQCQEPKTCGTPDDNCPPGILCARLLRADAPCDHGMGPGPSGGPQGACWALPGKCPGGDAADASWASCSNPPTCLSTCDAIRTEQPFRLSFTPCP